MCTSRPKLAIACLVVCILITATWVRGRFRADTLGFGSSKPGGRMWAAGVTSGEGGIALLAATDMPYRANIDGLFLLSEVKGYPGDLERITINQSKNMSPRWEAAGFLFVRVNGPMWGWAVAMPLWPLFLLTASYPAWHYRAWLRPERRRREKLGLCLRCGYDLRASAERCPECGEPVPATRCPKSTPLLLPRDPAAKSAAASSRS